MSKWGMIKLKDVATVATGSTPKTSIGEYWNGKYNWITPAELNDTTFVIYETERKITEKAIKDTSLKLLPIGTILLSSRAPIGKISIAGVAMYCNQGFKNLICSDSIYNKYLFWFLKGKTEFLNFLGRGATFKEISKTIVEKIQIPLPPLETQKQIAKILDTTSELLALRKKQLAELDNLIKSTFYDLFGDPVTNEKGWVNKKWAEALLIKNGKNQKKVQNENGNYPIYGSGGIMGYANDYICSENSVIIGRKGNINKPILVYTKFWNVDTAFGLEPNTKILNADYLYLFCLLYNFEKHNKTVTIPSLTKSDLLQISIPIPPITLQNQFATIVTKIKEQKALVKKAIDETQYLFDSLMSECFE